MSQNQQAPTTAAPQAAASMSQQQPRQPMAKNMMNQQSGQIQMMMQFAAQQQNNRHNQGHSDGQRTREPREKKPSVYVGNLPKDYYQLDLFKYVKGLGFNILNAYIGTDKVTKRQNRYGFLSFYTLDEAKRCARELNNTVIKGSSIRCNVQEDNFADPKSNVYVKNIDLGVTQQQLHEAFAIFGEISSCKLETYPEGKSRGFGYIQFKNVESAQQAVAKGNLEINGKKVDVQPHMRKDQRKGQEQKCLNIYVQGLPKGSDDNWLKDIFAKFGEVASAHVQRADSDDTLTNRGYVSFKEAESAQAAIEQMNKHNISENVYLLVAPHISQRDQQVAAANTSGGNLIQKQMRQTFQSNLFVKNVPSEITDTELINTFTNCGPVISVKMRQGKHFNPNAAYRQYFVLFKEVEDAKKAIQKYDQSTPFGTRPLSVQFWMPSNELHQERESRSQQEVQQYFFRSLYGPMGYGDSRGMRGDGGQFGGQAMPTGQMPRGQGKFNNRGGNNKPGNRGGARNNPPRNNQRMQGDATVQGQGAYMQGAAGQQPGVMPGMQMMTPEQQQMMYQQQQQQQQQQQNQQMQMQMQMQQNSGPLVPMEIFADSVDPNQRRQAIGNAIYPIIYTRYADLANKITGMLLDNEKIVDQQALVTNMQYLQQKASEAFQLLSQSNQGQATEGEPKAQ